MTLKENVNPLPSIERASRPNANLARLRFLWLKLVLRTNVYHTQLGHLKAKFEVENPADIILADYMMGERNLLRWTCSQMRKGDVIWDIGANVGHWAIFLGLSVGANGAVIAFEPYDKAAHRLHRNIRINGLDNVTVANLAISDTSGVVKLLVGEHSSYRRSSLFGSNADKKRLLVEQSSVDALVSSGRYPHPNAIKVDVEGAEHMVLRGMQRTMCDARLRIIVCEIHPAVLSQQGVAMDEVVGLLVDKGFECFQIPRGKEIHVVAYR